MVQICWEIGSIFECMFNHFFQINCKGHITLPHLPLWPSGYHLPKSRGYVGLNPGTGRYIVSLDDHLGSPLSLGPIHSTN